MKQLLLALVITTVVSACATTTSPTGRRQMVGGVSQAQLDQLGAQAFSETKQKEKISTDGRQNGYVQCVVNALVAQLPPQYRGVRWETAVFVDKEPNAFALPGGKVGVNTGIFTVAKNQDQLAAVIGHEIGHVIARHHEERITRQMGAQTGLAVLGALAGAAYGDGAASTVNQLGGMGAQAAFLLLGTHEIADYLDVVAAPQDVADLARAVLQTIEEEGPPEVKTLDLWNLPEGSPSGAAFARAAAEGGWSVRRGRLKPCPRASLEGGWEGYLARLDKKQRHELRRKMRRAAEHPHGTAMTRVSAGSGLDQSVDAFLHLMRLDGAKAGFLTPPMHDMFHSLTSAAAAG